MKQAKVRGADIVAGSLARAGVTHVFSLSGNHIMPVYDAALDAKLSIVHTRHEGAAVHMADAWGRLTGIPGIALLTGGPGHANGLSPLYTALASESPLVMLSGHAPLRELGKGSFQELRQADMAEPSVKASWTAQSGASLGEDIARAMRIAASGRPGPVHLSLPMDLLDDETEADTVPAADAFRALEHTLADASADAALAILGAARRPLILVGGVMADGRADAVRRELADALGIPVICMESPRGLNDPALGRLSGVVAKSDAILLLGKEPDFTLRFGQTLAAECRIAMIDPDSKALERAGALLGSGRVELSVVADSIPAARRLIQKATRGVAARDWQEEVESALRYRPPEWDALGGEAGAGVHPVEVGRAVQELMRASPEAVFVSDGGEFGQWAQACVDAPTRIINGPGGSIGSAIPFALAARVARPDVPIVAMTGDGAVGFHLLELDTAVRAGLPVVIVVGNDAAWNAEHQIQLRAYGKDRAHSCELLPTRYDEVSKALGGHGELVTTATELPAALARAADSGKPAVVNVMIRRLPAPIYTAIG